MKRILVPIVDLDSIDGLLDTALAVAARFESRVEAFCIMHGMADAFYEGATAGIVGELERQNQARADQAKQRFIALMGENGIALTDAAGTGPSARWRAAVEPGAAYTGSLGRLFDLIVIARPPRQAPGPAREVLEYALFESGRPVLVAPPAPPEAKFGETIVIAWNGSTESARAITYAMPFLTLAKKIYVLSVEGGMAPGPTAGKVGAYLSYHGVEVEAVHALPGKRSTGETILDEAASLGAGLLVKGAYTHTRLRQMIFGGATSHILGTTEIPVLMAH